MILNAKQILHITGGSFEVNQDKTIFANCVCIDSRQVTDQCLFAALAGNKVDGHVFIDTAIKSGASIVLCEKPINKKTVQLAKEFVACVILVDDVLCAVQKIAKAWRKKLSCKVLGLTGSSGKTTTKNLIKDVLSTTFKITATKRNFNNELGLPLTICQSNIDDEALILEMGMRGLGQIDELCNIASPDIGLITNVGTSHIELLGSRDSIANAKSELAKNLPDNHGILMLNSLDDYTSYIIKTASVAERNITVVLYGATKFMEEYEEYPQIWAEDLRVNEYGCYSFSAHAKGFKAFNNINLDMQVASVKLNISGIHNVYNALAAIATGCVYGMNLYDCVNAINQAKAHAGRFKIIKCQGGYSIIDDSYNANPDSMAASLNAFNSINKESRHIAVLGNMEELGKFCDAGHKNIGKLVYNLDVDLLICVGKKAKIIGTEAQNCGMQSKNILYCQDSKEALLLLEKDLKQDDLVLLKASNIVGLDYIVKALKD